MLMMYKIIDGIIKDVTTRYTQSCSLRAMKVAKFLSWSHFLIKLLNRHRQVFNQELDQKENNAFQEKEKSEIMPSNINHYKNHPL